MDPSRSHICIRVTNNGERPRTIQYIYIYIYIYTLIIIHISVCIDIVNISFVNVFMFYDNDDYNECLFKNLFYVKLF